MNVKLSTRVLSILMVVLLGSSLTVYGKAQENDEKSIRNTVTENFHLVLGKTIRIPIKGKIKRVSVGDPLIADVTVIGKNYLQVLGKKSGTTNLYITAEKNKSYVVDLEVSLDEKYLQSQLLGLFPTEERIKVSAAGNTFIVGGLVSNAETLHQIVTVAENITGKKIINVMGTQELPQVLLQVKVAEVQKTLDDKMGAKLTASSPARAVSSAAATNFLSGSNGLITIGKGLSTLSVDAQINDGRAKILAEPNIVAVSGQEASFLAGGKIYIPIPQSTGAGTTAITLQEEQYGVGLKFLPTVLSDKKINLRVSPEVSELSTTGTTYTVSGSTTVVPTITTRKASTTVELGDGDTFAIGGLISNNVTESINAFPILGELPVLGALFRSTEFQHNRTELVFLITVHLVKPSKDPVSLPTDNFISPTRTEFQLGGKIEGSK